jgi:hypothetical protein
MHGSCFAELEVLVSEGSQQDIVVLIQALLLCMLERFDQVQCQEDLKMNSQRYRAIDTFEGCYNGHQ